MEVVSDRILDDEKKITRERVLQGVTLWSLNEKRLEFMVSVHVTL